eukprot:3030143-Pleurochrysis_carterae.AAC.1
MHVRRARARNSFGACQIGNVTPNLNRRMAIPAETAQMTMEPVSYGNAKSSTQVAHIGEPLLDDCFGE